jgi:hypothetical protein
MEERRANERLREENRVAVTILSADDAPELINHTFFCPTEDVSSAGLRLCVHLPVPVGVSLELRIAFLRPLRTFRHEGHVVWLKQSGGQRFPYAIGIELTRLQDGAVEAWNRIIATKLSVRAAETAGEADAAASAE